MTGQPMWNDYLFSLLSEETAGLKDDAWPLLR